MGNLLTNKALNFQTTHKLDFLVADWEPLPGMPIANDFKQFRVGTCDGLWQATDTSYDILAITNHSPGNGHFEDVLQWFYASCLRDQKDLRILEVWNTRLRIHLLTKKGFKRSKGFNVIKKFKDIKALNFKSD